MNRKLLTIALLSTFFAVSCSKKNNEGPLEGTTGIENLIVPEGFTWENETDIKLSIGIADETGDAPHVISVYDAHPAEGGTLLSQGSASAENSFKTKIYLPTNRKQVYVVSSKPDGSNTIHKIELNSADISVNLGAATALTGIAAQTKLMANSASALATEPDCNTGCTRTLNVNSNNIDVNTGEVICVTGNNISVSFNIRNGGTVKICGTNVNVTGLTLDGKGTFIVTKNATATISNFNFNNQEAAVYNYGTMTIGNVTVQGILYNQGTITSNNDFNLHTNSSFTNNGNITVSGNMNTQSQNNPVNNGSITVKGTFQLNTYDFINNCTLSAGKLIVNGSTYFRNYSLVKVGGETTINASGEFILYNGAMITTNTVMLNGKFKGEGTTSLVKVKGNTTINGQGGVEGALQYCSEATLSDANKGKITNGAVAGCSVYIPVTSCNDTGNGQTPVLDTDGDGIPDDKDEYKDDPERAFNNYYPGKQSDFRATVAFEDKWPLKGDYDMNDIVVSYRYKVVTNAKNQVVQVVGNYTLIATGGDFENGFGVEFPVARNAVKSISGATLEEGQANAVAILFKNSRNEAANWNTEIGKPKSEVKNYTVDFTINSLPDLSEFGLGVYNPFIWNSAKGRTGEIHLAGKKPTSLADPALFGTVDDASSPAAGKYYVSAKGLPWAINIPTSPFVYPAEKVDITSAYLKLGEWVQSGGKSFTDWYNNAASGYRNSDNLYK